MSQTNIERQMLFHIEVMFQTNDKSIVSVPVSSPPAMIGMCSNHDSIETYSPPRERDPREYPRLLESNLTSTGIINFDNINQKR